MAERPKAPVLKTGDGQPSVGSNPTPSAADSRDGAYYVYVLRSLKNGRLYIGSSAQPDVRFGSHNAGRVRSTKAYRPWSRVLLEEHVDRETAETREWRE